MHRFLLLALSATCLVAGFADTTPAAPREEDTLQLPDMKISGGLERKDFAFPKMDEVTAPAFPANSPFIHVQFPGRAVYEGVATGRATVGVMLDASGQPRDFLLIRYTREYFGGALLEQAKHERYVAKRLHGAPVPGPFTFSYLFEPPDGLTAISSFEAADRRAEEVGGGPRYRYEPHAETELDAGALQPVRVVIPVLPSDHVTIPARPVRALVSFYVDETGRVRLPNVESDLPPALVALAVPAVEQWMFQPPAIRAKPVLVRAMRAVTFRQ